MEQEQLTEFKIQLALPAPNIEIAQEVANKAQVLINQFGYYQFLNLVDFMQRNPGAVSFGLNLIKIKDDYGRKNIDFPKGTER